MTESARDLEHRRFEAVWNQGRRDGIAEMLPPDAVLHEAVEDSVGSDRFYPFFDRMHAVFSAFRVTFKTLSRKAIRSAFAGPVGQNISEPDNWNSLSESANRQLTSQRPDHRSQAAAMVNLSALLSNPS